MNKASSIVLCIIGTAILFAQNTTFSPSKKNFAASVIFDLSGVLIDTNKAAMFKNTKPISTIFYTLSHLKNARTTLFEALDAVKPFNTYDHVACDDQGNPLPAIFCDYLAGIPSAQILERIADKLGTSGALWNIAQGIFDPTIFAKSLYIIDEGFELVKECIQQGHHVYILSNLDAVSFAILKEQYPELFNLFSGIVISGECHLIKPNPAIYDYLINTYKLTKSECLFIDDQLVNIKAAQNAGIQCIHCNKTWRGKPDFDAVRAELNCWLEKQEASA